MSTETEFSWMRVVLRVLYHEWTAEQALAAIRNHEQLLTLRGDMDDRLQAACEPAIPPGDFGDNLLLAMLSLRAKFPEPEGMAKLETNIAMRQRGTGGRFGS